MDDAKATTTGRPPTIGEFRVRVDFSSSKDDAVSDIKRKTAHLIDVLDDQKYRSENAASAEKARLLALAQTAYEEAVMWAEKALTA